MRALSILNDVLGPIMRGPSSSHTAGPFRIATLARALLGEEPERATFVFDPAGSFAQVYEQQGSHLGFAAGLMGWAITDERFPRALEIAERHGPVLRFAVETLPEADHPNSVELRLIGRSGRALRLSACSTGGGAVLVTGVQGWKVHVAGDAYEVLVEAETAAKEGVIDLLSSEGQLLGPVESEQREGKALVRARREADLEGPVKKRLKDLQGVREIYTAPAILFVQRGSALFSSAEEMLTWAGERGASLGRAALAYEAEFLGVSEGRVEEEILARFEVMRDSVEKGLNTEGLPMQLLEPSAGRIFLAEREGRLAAGGLHSRAAARAMAVMHHNSGMGVVCAAPTAGSAGVLASVVVTLVEDMGISREQGILALLAGGAIGLVAGTRATFAAEIGGCQVEIGASGAMAAAAVVEAAGGTAAQAADAAAIAFQNTMGSVCDPVQGVVEIPCHTRNAVAASAAFVCADLVLGGYKNPIPLDETIDAVHAVGRMLPRELRCTALGGLSAVPSALKMKRKPIA